MSPIPLAGLEAMRGIVDRLASPDFGVDEFFDPPERIRELLAKLVGGEAAAFSLTGSASFGMATLAWNLRVAANELVGERRRIVGLDGQFPSNVQPWRRLEGAGFEFELVPGGEGATDRLLEAIDERTALVALGPLAWTDGRRIDVGALGRRAADCGALYSLDVTQSSGVDASLPDDLQCDLVVGAGYKWLLGPYGTGFMRLSSELQERLEPLEANWKNFARSDDFNRLNDYRPDFYSPAARFDHGESSAFVRLAGWEAALLTLIEIGPANVAEHALSFGKALAEGLDGERFEISAVEAADQATHLFRVAPRDSDQFESLSLALGAAGVSVSQRDGGWRISPHVYNNGADIERFLQVLS